MSLSIVFSLLIALFLTLSAQAEPTSSSAAAVQKSCPNGVELVVGFAAGSITDLFARTIGQKITNEVGLPAIVVNKPGASGQIAVEYMTTKRNCALMITTASTWVIGPTILATKIVPEQVMQPIAMLGASPFVLVVAKDLGVSNLNEFFERAKKDDLTYTSPGIGTAVHLPIEILFRRLGIRALHIPMKGSAEALSYVVGGHAHFTMTGPSLVLGPVEAGQVIALGASSTAPFSAGRFTWPTIQSVLPQDYAFSSSVWIGLTANRNMPETLAQDLNGLVNGYLSDPALIASMRQQGYELEIKSIDQFSNFLKDESIYWKREIQTIGAESLR